MSIFDGFLQAGQYLYAAMRRVFDNPANDFTEDTFYQRELDYLLLWAYYNGSMFDKSARLINGFGMTGWTFRSWDRYRANYNLYRNIRLIYNPTRRLVDFYAGTIYPGVLSEDGDDLPDGVSLAIPFSEDTTPELKSAIAQFWEWSNWQAKKSVEVRYGAALGSVLVEVVDDFEKGYVCAEIVWPGFIWDLELDYSGNVTSYVLQYSAKDEDGFYLYKKEVDINSFRYYRNDIPYDYGQGTIVPNIYGFIPAVWIKHQDTGSDHGSPCIAGSMAKIDELNSLASHVHDQIHKVIGSPMIMWSSGSIANLFPTAKRGPTSEFVEPTGDQENVLMLKGPPDGRIDSLAGNLVLGDTLPVMLQLQSEIEDDNPELTLYKKLREMSQVTGPAAARLVGDVSGRVTECQAIYDQYNIRLFGMAVAIGGFRANSGAWGILNDQQKKFLPFNLDSYKAGDLEMAIMPRPLLTPTKLEKAQESQALWLGVQAGAKAGVPLKLILAQEGWTDEELAELDRVQQEEDAADQAKFEQQQKVIAQNNPPQQQQGNNPQQSSNNPANQQNGKQPVGTKG